MNKKQKALLHSFKAFSEHIGHTIEIGMTRTPHKLEGVMIINDVVMLKVEGQTFATEYADAAKGCSCGVGQNVVGE